MNYSLILYFLPLAAVVRARKLFQQLIRLDVDEFFIYFFFLRRALDDTN